MLLSSQKYFYRISIERNNLMEANEIRDNLEFKQDCSYIRGKL